jgi:hypothetical protein
MLNLTFRPMPRAVVMVSAALAASAVLLAATDCAHAFMRMPMGGAGTLRPAMAARLPSPASTGNLELTVKILNTGQSRRPGYATGETMVHIESGLPSVGRGTGKTPSIYKMKRPAPLWATSSRNNGAQPYTPPIGWKFSNLKVRITR